MSFMKPIAKVGGFGLAGLAATKKGGALAALSPAAALIRGGKKKEPKTPSLVARGGGPYDSELRPLSQGRFS